MILRNKRNKEPGGVYVTNINGKYYLCAYIRQDRGYAGTCKMMRLQTISKTEISQKFYDAFAWEASLHYLSCCEKSTK